MTNIKINAEKWNKLSAAQQEKAIALARDKGWIGAEETLVPDGNVPVPNWVRPKIDPGRDSGKRDCYDACEDYGDVVYIACEPHDTADNCADLAWDAVEQCIYENCE